MAITDFLEKVGKGAEKGLQAAGSFAAPVLERTAQVVSGEAPKLDEEKRQREYAQEDALINAQAKELENQLAIGEKYGTLTPQDRQQYVDAIAGLYKHPRHAKTLMEKMRQAVYPQGATYNPGSLSTLKNATPEGGTAAEDEKRAEALAQARYTAARANNPRLVALDKFTEEKYGTNFNESTPEQQDSALEQWHKSTTAPKYTSHIVADPDSPTGYSYGTWDVVAKTMVSKMPGITPPRGYYPTERVSKSTDQYGNVTETVSEITPQIPGVGATPPVGQVQPSSLPTVKPTAAKPTVGSMIKSVTPPGGVAGVKPVVPPSAPQTGSARALTPPTSPVSPRTSVSPLDSEGHIPPAPGVNEQVRELANELMDGRDLKDIPQKAKSPAADLARKYGWEQGALTPKEKIQVGEASNFLTQLQKSPSLSVLDDPTSRAKIVQVLGKHTGMVGSQITSLVAQNLSPQESEFIRQFNAAAGAVSGLAQLTRGGRPVESSIQRLMAELPNVIQSSGSEDAKARIGNLLKEIDIAKEYRGNTPVGGIIGNSNDPMGLF